jgi:hypothetical protein
MMALSCTCAISGGVCTPDSAACCFAPCCCRRSGLRSFAVILLGNSLTNTSVNCCDHGHEFKWKDTDEDFAKCVSVY